MSLRTHEFCGFKITEINGMLNATQIAHVFNNNGKEIKDELSEIGSEKDVRIFFSRTKRGKESVEFLTQTLKVEKDKIIKSLKNGPLMIHPLLIIELMVYISPKYEYEATLWLIKYYGGDISNKLVNNTSLQKIQETVSKNEHEEMKKKYEITLKENKLLIEELTKQNQDLLKKNEVLGKRKFDSLEDEKVFHQIKEIKAIERETTVKTDLKLLEEYKTVSGIGPYELLKRRIIETHLSEFIPPSPQEILKKN